MPKTSTSKRPRETNRHGLGDQLRAVIESRGLTAYAAGRAAGVDPGVVQRFLTGERDIRLETADRLAAALGLRLVEVGRATRGRPRTARPAEPATVATRPDEAVERDDECIDGGGPFGPAVEGAN